VGTLRKACGDGSCRLVHPHVRGDIGFRYRATVRFPGSPPRAWGHWWSIILGEWGVGFTPTCVGTFTSSSSRLLALGVHPHVRGDIAEWFGQVILLVGSPPRAWGHFRNRGQGIWLPRFTPTCVGTLGVTASSRSALQGSPPRAWGHLYKISRNRQRRRFTPTCVGTLTDTNFRRRMLQVHPHVRGDIGLAGCEASPAIGSPPRAWGHSGEEAG